MGTFQNMTPEERRAAMKFRKALRQNILGVYGRDETIAKDGVTASEIYKVQPATEQWLKDNGYGYERELDTPSGRVDFHAQSPEGWRVIIECKRNCTNILKAINQVNRYLPHFEEGTYAAIAVPHNTITDLAEQICTERGVWLISVPIDMADSRYRIQERFSLDADNERERNLGAWIDLLKRTRQYRPTVVNALDMYRSLMEHRLDELFYLFPWVKDEFDKRG